MINTINGIILFEGISPIDNKSPIVCIATGFKKRSANPKTGDMIQVWILRQDMHPSQAIDSGDDQAICGNCPHRKYDGKRSCYVNPMGPASVYRAYLAGNYVKFSPKKHLRYFAGRSVRWGAYGDPVCIPYETIETVNSVAYNHTGYTHQWRDDRFSCYRDFFMASCDNLGDYLNATDQGWSTFRVLRSAEENVRGSEVTCQGGIKTQCAICSLCDGAKDRVKSVTVKAHGNGAKYLEV